MRDEIWMGLVGQQERDAKMGTVRDLREDVWEASKRRIISGVG